MVGIINLSPQLIVQLRYTQATFTTLEVKITIQFVTISKNWFGFSNQMRRLLNKIDLMKYVTWMDWSQILFFFKTRYPIQKPTNLRTINAYNWWFY